MSAPIEQAIEGLIRKALEDAATPPQQRQQKPQPRWTLKRLAQWLNNQFSLNCCRETVRQRLKRLGFSWKKARKLLNKANPEKRAEFLKQLEVLFEQTLKQEHLLVYIDEAHIRLDAGEGYGWSIRGERFWVSSCSPGLIKVSFYGLYLYNLAQVRLFAYDRADSLNTIDVLKQLRVEFPDRDIALIWDGASYHRSALVKEAALVLEIGLVPLPAYSPDFMPVEHLWHWLREDITYHTCYETKAELIEQVTDFAQQLNTDTIAIADRLWVTTHLDTEVEKLRVST